MSGVGFALSAPLPIRDVIALAQAAEGRGYESFWLTEGASRDSISQMGALAVSTSRIKLGTGIVNIFSRTPSLMALTANTLAELSGGRFILGLGAGHKLSIENQHGVPFRQPVTRMGDYMRIIKAALRDKRASYQGKAWSVPNFQMVTSRREPDPPIYIATLAERMSRLAGELADGALPLLATPAGVREVVATVQEGAQAAGRDPAQIDIACYVIACAGADASAEAEARRQVARYGSMPFYQGILRRSGYGKDADALAKAWADGDSEGAMRVVSEALLSEVTLLGPAEQWRQRLDSFRAAGVTHPIVYAAPAGADPVGSVYAALALGAP